MTPRVAQVVDGLRDSIVVAIAERGNRRHRPGIVGLAIEGTYESVQDDANQNFGIS